MTRVVSFNANNWENIYSASASAVIYSDNSYVPIPPISVPILLESDIVAVYVNTTIPTGRNWRYGGFCEQRFTSGLLVGGGVDTAGQPSKIWIDQITPLFFPQITAQYSLRFHFPRRFKSVSLTLWQYTGPDDTDEKILMAEEFANLNFKLDQLINQ